MQSWFNNKGKKEQKEQPTAVITSEIDADNNSGNFNAEAGNLAEEEKKFDNEQVFQQQQHEDEAYEESFPEPTEEEAKSLRRVMGYAPWYCYLILFIEFAERSSYYCVTNVLNNFIQLPLPEGGPGTGAIAKSSQQAGALGLGLQAASGITLMLTFLAYCFPLYTGYVSDVKWGRFKMLWAGVLTGIIGHLILIFAAIPSVIARGKSAMAAVIIGIILLAMCTSFIKPVLLPTLMAQYPHETDVVVTLKTGERVIMDKDSSLQRMSMIFYFSINLGAFVAIGSGYLARDHGYWAAFLLPMCLYLLIPIILIPLQTRMKDIAPSGRSVMVDSMKVLKVCFEGNWIKRYRKGQFWDYAKPANLKQMGRIGWKKNVPGFYPDSFVDDTKVTVSASTIFLYFVIFNLNDAGISGMSNNLTLSMKSDNVPNDLINNFNPLAIIFFIPFLDYCVYPLFRKMHINFKPVFRIFTGFMVAAGASVSGAVMQYYIYKTSPCGYYATECAEKGETAPISLYVVCVYYAITGISECFAMTSCYQLAFERSPSHMKGFVMSLFLFTSALSAALGEIVTPSLVDPHLIIPFGVLAGIGAAFAFLFLIRYWNLDKVMAEEERLRLEREAKTYVSGESHSVADEYMISQEGVDLEAASVTSDPASNTHKLDHVLSLTSALDTKLK
ncbi:related to H+/oligopeptide symporter [Saccharomycodes ludwigii]|uniref:Related to H+/oligopeptide symporter n=1 Tax=Saccharomycodes ludwigii TaxID=36035 RepID=A0A376B9K7_9ASCO|nr:hypothetical protein SCDLUD_004337 [Saccharomycodes ludwigii]KAH3900020.1 hypothetical protein SCDLUD_004337 [Saccharomycodes ludwigii]SSD61365.1 related to H+/oligopeptide symporter [Saccharomycodes ludwigii]